MTSTTLVNLWRRVANEIGSHQVATVTTAAVGPDPGRWLISTALQAAGSAPQHIGHFVQLNTGGTGNVRVAGEEPSLGAIATDRLLSATTAIVTTSEYEVTWPLPIQFTEGIVGLVTMLQEAMREVYYLDTLDLAPAAGEYTVDLSDQEDWLTEDRVQRLADGSGALYDPPIVSGYPQQEAGWRYGEIYSQAGVPTLRLKRAYLRTIDATSPAQLGVIRPVYSLVGGVESAAGPAASTDTVGGDPAEIVAVTKLKAYKYLAMAQHLSDAERQRYAAMIDPQEAWVRANIRHYLPRDEMPQQASAASVRAA